jgi:YesN/AraC family two-component response regulator
MKTNNSEEAHARRSRVLIVDDSPVMSRMIKDVITGLPRMELVGQARDGVEALEAIQNLKPDLLVMDISMPRLSGLEVLKRMPKDNCCVIMLSAHADPYYVEKCREYHADHYFDRMTDFHDFVECVSGM